MTGFQKITAVVVLLVGGGLLGFVGMRVFESSDNQDKQRNQKRSQQTRGDKTLPDEKLSDPVGERQDSNEESSDRGKIPPPSDSDESTGDPKKNSTSSSKKRKEDSLKEQSTKKVLNTFLESSSGTDEARKTGDEIIRRMRKRPGKTVSVLEGKLKSGDLSELSTSRILQLLHDSGEIQGQLLLADLLDSERESIVRAALRMLEKLINPVSDLVDALMHQVRSRKISDPMFPEFVQAARNLSVRAIEKRQLQIRKKLLRALGRKQQLTLKQIKKRLSRSESEIQRVQTVGALERHSSHEAKKMLMDSFEQSSSQFVSDASIRVLSNMTNQTDGEDGTEEEKKQEEINLREFFTEKIQYSGRPFVRYVAVEYFGSRLGSGSPKSKRLLQDAADKDSHAGVRTRAAFYLNR